MKCLTRTDIQTIGRRIREVEPVTITGHSINNNNNIHHNTEAVTLLTTTTATITRGEGVVVTTHPEVEVPVLAGVGATATSRVTAIVATTTTAPRKIHNNFISHNTINNTRKVRHRFILHPNSNNTSKPGVDNTNPGVTGEDLRDI